MITPFAMLQYKAEQQKRDEFLRLFFASQSIGLWFGFYINNTKIA
jgi:hypothetical protein